MSLFAFSSRLKKSYMPASLYTRIVILALLPLIIMATLVMAVTTTERKSATRTSIDDQRTLLVQVRHQGVADVVQMARSALKHVLENNALTQDQKREQSRQILRDLRFEGGNYVFVVDYDGITQVQPAAPQLEGQGSLGLRDDTGRFFIREMLELAKQGGGRYEYDWLNPETGNVETKYSYAAGIPELGWMIGAGVYVTAINSVMAEVEQSMHEKLIAALLRSLLIFSVSLIVIALIAVYASRRVISRIQSTAQALDDISNKIAQGRGDLSQRVQVIGRDEIALMGTRVNEFLAKMQRILLEVRGSAMSVAQASDGISQLSESLSSRTVQAAANLEQTSAAMEEITATVQQSASMAEQANQITVAASKSTESGHVSMKNVEQTMFEIRDASRQIGEIVGTIDGIAFQTNILALNASVEAARAGQHGRGFAIVAQEVRSLAQRSAQAAGEIRRLIDASAARIKAGEEVVNTTATLMHDIVERIDQVTLSMDEITRASREQSEGILQVNQAVTEMDAMTQQNAAMVQETNNAAENMRGYAGRLAGLLTGFTLDGSGGAN